MQTQTQNNPIVLDGGIYKVLQDGHLDLFFHEGQNAVWNSNRRFILMLAGSQGGKTSFGPWWLWREIAIRGQGDYLAVTTNFDLFKLKMLPEMRRVFEHVLRIGRYWPGIKVMELRNPLTGRFDAVRADDPMWGRVILRSVQAPMGLESATAKAAWLDEVGQDDWDVTHWEALLRRLALNKGRILGTTTPYNTGFIKTEWYDRWAEGDTDYDVVRFASSANPKFSAEEYERARRTMPEWRFRMFYNGEFSRPAGLIYGDFTDDMVVSDNEIPVFQPYYRRVVGIDFGGANTASLLLVEDQSQDPSVWYVMEEHLSGHLSTMEHTNDVLRMVAGARDVSYVGGAPGEGQFRMDWAQNGVDVQIPSISEVELGINAVIGLIKSNRLRVSRHCSGLRHELSTYKRKLERDGQPSEIIDNKNRFHRVDALRYAVTAIHGDSQQEAWVI